MLEVYVVIECPKCHKQFPIEAKFCTQCGINIEYYAQKCKDCSNISEKNANFCMYCGSQNLESYFPETDEEIIALINKFRA